MKILGIVGSPRNKGNTYKMVKWVLDAVEEEGASVENLALSELNIRYCKGCNKCFIEGECPQKDDVELIHEKMLRADGIVFGAPSYVMHVPAQTKTFIDRSTFIIHRPQFMGKFSVIVSPSAAGLGEDIVVDYLEGVLYAMGVTSVGKLTAIAYGPGIFPDEEKVRSEAKQLGIKLVEAIKDERKTHKVVKSYMPSEEVKQVMSRVGMYLKADYEFWKEKGWLKEVEEKKKAHPMPETCKELIEGMPLVFHPEQAKGLDLIV